MRAFLTERGVHTILQWGGYAIHQFEELGLKGLTQYTERITKRYMLLPMNTSLTDDDLEYVCDAIIEFYCRI